jgi:hypothetical protein
MPTTESFPRALGYFSLGLAGAQVAAPGAVARLIGLKSGSTSSTVLRAIGVRELTAGAALLADQSRTPVWLWGRVAGDMVDLALLGLALSDKRNHRGRLAAALASVIGVTVADALAARTTQPEATRQVKSVTVRRSPEEVSEFWRTHVGSSGRVRFKAAPGGRGTEIYLEVDSQDETDLREIKQILETGEVVRSSATLEGNDLLQRPAQPVEVHA